MGFVRGNMLPLLKEHQQRPFSGSLLCLGYPDIYFTQDQYRKMCLNLKIELDRSVKLQISNRPWFGKKGFISAESLFSSLGFKEVTSLDYSQFEGASISFDLNAPHPPSELLERYDFIMDHGTLEHVFHLPNALNNIFAMLRVGGRIFISSPTSNFVDHGFYMLSPTLFYDYFTANKFEINAILVTQSSPQQQTEPCFYTDYEPGSFNNVSYGGLNNSIYGTICIAQKTGQSTGNAIPQQGLYNNEVWKSNKHSRYRRFIEQAIGIAKTRILRISS